MTDQTEPAIGPIGAVAPKTFTVSYDQFAAALKQAKQHGVDLGAGDPPPGYEELPPEQASIADACWHHGMDSLETALLNWADDKINGRCELDELRPYGSAETSGE